jgi:hypothetical protein
MVNALFKERGRAWIARWGFAVMVATATAMALAVAATVAIPSEVPGVALQAPALYRAEVGGAIFLGLYLMSLAFVLALRNRGFTEIGTAGVRASRLDGLPEALQEQERSLKLLLEIVNERRDRDRR